MSTKLKIQKVRAEIEAHEERGWLKGYEEGLAKREQEVSDLQGALEARNEKIRELTSRKKSPKTAREALELAWELAHPVKEGQVIPQGTRYLTGYYSEVKEYTAQFDIEITPERAQVYRTLDPLPEPEPDWLDAPAVLARVDGWVACADPQVFARHDYHDAPSEWRYNGAESFRWQELTDVTPLYPKGLDA